MSVLVIIFLMCVTRADSSSMDEIRLKDFKSYVLKKEAYEVERQSTAGSEKQRRVKREDIYEKQRASFKRVPDVDPPGKEDYERKMSELEKKYDQIRDAFAAKQQQLMNTYHEKMDRTKMIEYELE